MALKNHILMLITRLFFFWHYKADGPHILYVHQAVCRRFIAMMCCVLSCTLARRVNEDGRDIGAEDILYTVWSTVDYEIQTGI